MGGGGQGGNKKQVESMEGSNRTETGRCCGNPKKSEDILKSGWKPGVSKEPGMEKQDLQNGERDS